jgi:hypothetical protein
LLVLVLVLLLVLLQVPLLEASSTRYMQSCIAHDHARLAAVPLRARTYVSLYQ